MTNQNAPERQGLRRWVRSSLKRRLLTSAAVFWVVAVTAVSLAFLGFGQNYMLDETSQRNTQIASIIARDLNARVNAIMADARNFSRHLDLLSPDSGAQIQAALSLRLSAPQRYRSVYIFDDKGVTKFYINDPLETLFRLSAAEVQTRPAIQVTQEVLFANHSARLEGIYVSDVARTTLEDIPVIQIGLRLGGSAGVIVLEIDLQDLWGTLQQITLGDTGFVYLVSDQGTVISHPESAEIGRSVDQMVRSLSSGNEGFVEYRGPTGEVFLAAYSPVGGITGWGVVVQQLEDEAHAPIDRMAATIVGIWVVMALVGTAAIFRYVNNLTRPIVRLTEATNAIASTGHLTRIPTPDRADELGQLSRSFDRMIERLQATEGKLEHAAADERNRLARDLHDAVSQTLFAACIIAEVLPKLWQKNPEEGRRRLEELQRLTRGALAEMRTLLFELRPLALLEAEMSYLLRQLVESFNTRQPTPVKLEIEEECAMTPEVKTAFYRIAQEALNNIGKHAQASQIAINLRCDKDTMVLTVSDDGTGFDPARTRPGSLGLGIMGDRAREVGAEVSIESQPGRGTKVTARWKIPGAAA